MKNKRYHGTNEEKAFIILLEQERTMSQSSKAASSPRQGRGTVLWIVGILSFGLVAVVLVGLFIGLATSNIPVPKVAATLHLIKDVSLPSAAVPPTGHAPIQSLPVDGFDFQ